MSVLEPYEVVFIFVVFACGVATGMLSLFIYVTWKEIRSITHAGKPVWLVQLWRDFHRNVLVRSFLMTLVLCGMSVVVGSLLWKLLTLMR